MTAGGIYNLSLINVGAVALRLGLLRGQTGVSRMDLDPDELALGLRLNLGNLNQPSVCVGYQVGCVRECCKDRRQNVSGAFLAWLEQDDDADPPDYWKRAEKPVQPWEIAA